MIIQAPEFRKVNQFSTDKDQAESRSVVQFEENVAQIVLDLKKYVDEKVAESSSGGSSGGSFVPILTTVSVSTDYTASFFELVQNTASLKVTMPKITMPDDKGKCVGTIESSSGMTIAASPGDNFNGDITPVANRTYMHWVAEDGEWYQEN